jgi:hypothetical protein
MPAHRKRSGEADSAFFAALERGEPVSHACRVTGCSRQALYRRRINDLVFDRRRQEAEAVARAKKAEDRPRRRTGVTLPIFAARRCGGNKNALSDGMLLARLKAARPAYRDKS